MVNWVSNALQSDLAKDREDRGQQLRPGRVDALNNTQMEFRGGELAHLNAVGRQVLTAACVRVIKFDPPFVAARRRGQGDQRHRQVRPDSQGRSPIRT